MNDDVKDLRNSLLPYDWDERNQDSDYARGVDAVLALLEPMDVEDWGGVPLYRIKEVQ